MQAVKLSIKEVIFIGDQLSEKHENKIESFKRKNASKHIDSLNPITFKDNENYENLSPERREEVSTELNHILLRLIQPSEKKLNDSTTKMMKG